VGSWLGGAHHYCRRGRADRGLPEGRGVSALRAIALSFLLVALVPAAGCGARALDPKGPAARSIAQIWWVMFAGSVLIMMIVVAALVYALRRRPDTTDLDPAADLPDERGGRPGARLILWGGIVMPIVLLIPLLGYTIYVLKETSAPPSEPVLTVEVVSHDWWWEVRYPDLGLASANEIHIPVGQPVEVKLRSADVIHAFWVPELHGKTDHMPGFETNTWLQADEPGSFRGQCGEFCGLQHARMHFLVIAHEQEEFDEWLRERQDRPGLPEDPEVRRGQQVFLGSACVYCHTVAGTNASGRQGPDLTDLASRAELGAGTLRNTRGNLAGWIIDSQSMKPGNLMPAMPMEGEDLQALLAYLDTLR
jgi:cytochrome c oxidase subunit II